MNKIELNTLYNDDCLNVMAKMPDNYVDQVAVSFPYGSLRTYKNDIKAEDKFKGYSFDFEKIAKEIARILKPGGTFISIIGYHTVEKQRSLDQLKQCIYLVEECKLLFHDHLIYEKSSFSFPDKSRYYPVWESIYVFSKGSPKTFNPIDDREVKYQQSRGKSTQRQQDGSLNDTGRGIIKYKKVSRRFNIWRYSTGYGNSTRDKIAYNHPATAPEKLMEDIILSWTNKGDLVYDPMAGSGTTLKMAKKLERNWIGSELSKEYCDIIEERLGPNNIDVKAKVVVKNKFS